MSVCVHLPAISLWVLAFGAHGEPGTEEPAGTKGGSHCRPT